MPADAKRISLASLRDGEYVGEPRSPEQESRDWDIDGSGTALDRIWRDWDEAGVYVTEINLERACKVYKDYAEGSGRQAQYMPESLPRVVLPVVPSIINQKVATICQDPAWPEYLSNKSESAGRTMTDFAHSVLDRIGFQKHLKSCVRYSLIEPASYLHLYWDEDAIGPDAIAKGSVKMERVSVLRVRVANKDVKDIQDQEWVIIASREKVKRVRDALANQADRDLVRPDMAEFDRDLTENGGLLCTVLTRYFRVDGEVYFEKACRGCMLCPPTPFNPNLDPLRDEAWREMEPEHEKSPDADKDGRVTKKDRAKWTLYPIELLVMKEQDDSYLGISDVEDMISGQNAINVMYSLAVQNGIDIQNKYVVKDGALENQTITNEVGEVLVDHTRGSGFGIQILSGAAQMTNQMLQLPLSLVETIRKLKSSSDVTMGDVSKEYSATAISLLQTAAEKPTEDMTVQKEEFVVRVGRVLLLFLKFYYEDTRYMFNLPTRERKSISERFGMPLEKVPSRVEGVFSGEEYIDDVFDVKVSVGGGGRVSQATEFSFLQSFFQLIPNLTVQQQRILVKRTPDTILHSKQELLDMIDEQESGELAKAKAIIEQQNGVIESLKGGAKEMGSIIQMLQAYVREYESESGRLIANKDRQIASLLGQADQAIAQPNQGNDGQKPVS